jgi:hypothetical protein
MKRFQVEKFPKGMATILTRDHLGSTRMVTDQAANLISRRDYLPFGEEITTGNDRLLAQASRRLYEHNFV